MNDNQVTDLFRHAGVSVQPDIPRLVDGGRALGVRHRRRRRSAAAALAGLAAGAVALALALPHGGGEGGGESIGPAAPAQVDVRRVAIPPAEMSTVLAGLLPGARPLDDDEPFVFQSQRGVVTWHGVEVSVSIDSRTVGSPGSARRRCEVFRGTSCTRAPGGGWINVHGKLDGLVEPGTTEIWSDAVQLFEPDGYVIEAFGERGDAEKVDQGGGSDADVDLLTRLVVDDGWFR